MRRVALNRELYGGSKMSVPLERTINNQMQLRFDTGLVQYFD